MICDEAVAVNMLRKTVPQTPTTTTADIYTVTASIIIVVKIIMVDIVLFFNYRARHAIIIGAIVHKMLLLVVTIVEVPINGARRRASGGVRI